MLRASLAVGAPSYHVGDGNDDAKSWLFADTKKHEAKPDLVVTDATGRSLIADVKYKNKVDRENVDQVIAYAMAYNAGQALLLHYRAPDKPAMPQRLGKIAQVDVWTYGVDLSSGDLEKEEGLLEAFVRQRMEALI
jgi:5-methylcytosine-specific restriction enzyme subunit McrC